MAKWDNCIHLPDGETNLDKKVLFQDEESVSHSMGDDQFYEIIRSLGEPDEPSAIMTFLREKCHQISL